MAFRFDWETAIITTAATGFFGGLAYAFNRWRRRSQHAGRFIAGILMTLCGLIALVWGICGLAIIADGGLHIQ